MYKEMQELYNELNNIYGDISYTRDVHAWIKLPIISCLANNLGVWEN